MTREEAEAIYGPISIDRTANMTPHLGWDWCASFDDLVDLDMPSWAHSLGHSPEAALSLLLEQTAEHVFELGSRLLEHAIMHNYDRCREWRMSYDEATRAHAILFRKLNEEFPRWFTVNPL